MDTIANYRQIIEALLNEYAVIKTDDNNTIKTELIIDRERDHYQLIDMGWDGPQRIYSVVMHFMIVDGRVWVQQNATSEDIAEELVTKGIPRTDIVLGFYPAYIRPHTEFAAG